MKHGGYMRRLFSIILTLALALGALVSASTPSTAADDWASTLGDLTNLNKAESTYELVQWPDTWRSKKGAVGRQRKSYYCKQLGQDPCTAERVMAASKVYPLNPDKSITQDFMNREWAIIGYAEFGACKDENDFGCIESVAFANEGKPLVPAKFIEHVSPSLSRPGQLEYNAINSESDSVWRTDAGKEVTVSNVARLEFSSGKVNYNDFKLVIARSGADEGSPTPLTAKIQLRAPRGIGGWFYGRLEGIDISYTAATANYSKLTVQGTSVLVPSVNFSIPRSKISASDQKTIGGDAPFDGYHSLNSDVSKRAKLVQIVAKHNGNASTSEDNIWMFGQNTGWWGPSSCFFDVDPVTGVTTEFAKPKVLGFVTTNAMVFDSFPAAFANGNMDFQVAGLHYDSNKKLTQGHYEMVMDAAAARCFYHYTEAPVSATISVINESGENKIATRSVKVSGNVIKLVADNFTFSSPRVRVKLKGKLAPKKTLVCAKGSSVKKVLDWEPVCPPGYAPKK